MKRTYDHYSGGGFRYEDSQHAKRHRQPDTWAPAGSGHYRSKEHYRSEEQYRSKDREHRGDPRDPPVKQRPGKKNAAKHKDGTHLSDKIHSLRRLLDKATNLPADVRQEKERELAGYLHDQALGKKGKDRRNMVGKYHFVRFMERRKAERRLKKAKAAPYTPSNASKSDEVSQATVSKPASHQEGEVSDDSDHGGGVELPQAGKGDTTKRPADEKQPLDQAEYERRLHEAEVDLNYTLFAPLDEKYISLFAADKPEHRNAEACGILHNQTGEKPPRWYDVEAAMAKGTLGALRDGKWAKETVTAEKELTMRVLSENNGTVKVKASDEAKQLGGLVATEDDGRDDSDSSVGDFFER